MHETCSHSRKKGDDGLCLACRLNKKAAYDLTGTHDPKEQKEYWDRVWKQVHKLRKERFKRKLKQGY